MKLKIAPSAARRAKPGEPPWEIAYLFPPQGQWSESAYLALKTNRLVEFADGFIEVLPMPTMYHQLIVDYLFTLLKEFVLARGLGKVFFSPLPVHLWPGKYREPDIVFVRANRIKNLHGQPHGADLVMEVVSEGEENRRRDLEIKPEEYAKAHIKEYWIVDPEKRQITVMKLVRKKYKVHGVFGMGSTATSALLSGFVVQVDGVFVQQ